MMNMGIVEFLLILIVAGTVLLFGVGLVVAVIFTTTRQTGKQNPASASTITPREILQQRYARGEITREQYQSILSDLENRQNT